MLAAAEQMLCSGGMEQVRAAFGLGMAAGVIAATEPLTTSSADL